MRMVALHVMVFVALASRWAHPGEPEDARPPVLSPVELEAFVDGYMASYLEQANVAGATVAFIDGEETIFAKGYGFADVEARTPVDAEDTLFRIGSVSKLFVWTSVMQLVERGELNLLADINEYLDDVEVPEAYGSPVNMVQLMTHTAGLDERVIGLFARDPSTLRPLGDILRDELPARVRPPGELTSYSNHGTALAMHVVEQVSGVPWEDYIRNNILAPLDLRSTSFTQPPPGNLSARVSKGYRFENGAFVEAPFELVPMAPIGGASSTASDMARFMAAHLGLGALGEQRILGDEAARLMQSTLFRHHPEVNGMAHGLIELEVNGQRALGHGGDTELFHTLFAFFPDHGFGMFVSFNSAGANYIAFLRAFADWKFPLDDAGPTPTTAAASHLERFAGSYRPTRFPHRSIAKVIALAASVEIEAAEDHLVTMLPRKRRWDPVEPLLFRERGGSETIAFREDVNGRISHLFFDEAPFVAFEPTPASEAPGLVSLVLAVGFSAALIATVFWPLAAVVRRHYGVTLPRERRIPPLARWTGWSSSFMLVGFALSLSIALADPMAVVYGLPARTRLLFSLPAIALPLAIVAALGCVHAWRRRRGSVPGRLAFTLLVLAIGLFLWQLDLWNLIGYHD